MRAVTRLARALLAAWYGALDHDVDTERGFLERAEHLLEREEQRRAAAAVTPRTVSLEKLPRISRVTYVGSGRSFDVPTAPPAEIQRRAQAS